MAEANKASGKHRLTAQAVRRATAPGMYADGDGLFLQVATGRDGAPRKSWLVRYTSPEGKRREMGLGRADLVGLAAARRLAHQARASAATGTDPLASKAAARAEAAAEAARALTFREAAERYIAAHEAGWRNPKHRQQWANTLAAYAFPALGEVSVGAVDTAMVLNVLAPIWTAKPETAGRVRGRIEAILDWAAVAGHRSGENPARWRGHLQKALPARAKLGAVQHHRASPVADMPALWAALGERSGAGADCLRFLILTAARSGEARGATWGEFDLDAATWTIPAGRMKGGRAHRVPLTAAALDILRLRRDAHGAEPTALVFASDLRARAMLSDATLGAVLKRSGRSDTAHGFRSTFRDWAAERTGFPRELAEAALAHAVADKTEAAYARSDLLERRRSMMAAWAQFLEGGAAVEVAEPRRRKQTA